MLPYEHIKSIHDQKQAQYIAERDKAQLAAIAKAGKPGLIDRLASAVVEALGLSGKTLDERRRRPIRLA